MELKRQPRTRSPREQHSDTRFDNSSREADWLLTRFFGYSYGINAHTFKGAWDGWFHFFGQLWLPLYDQYDQVGVSFLKIFLFLLFGLSVSSISYSYEWPCGEAKSNIARQECFRMEVGKADKELNMVYQQAINEIQGNDYLPEAVKSKYIHSLREAERHWVKFKEIECGSVRYDYYGGSHAPLAAVICEYEKTIHRAKEIRSRFFEP